MKFLALKAELEKWQNHEKNEHVKECGVSAGNEQKTSLQKTPIYSPRTPEKVVGGDVLWKPVNKIAALLIAKPPWWAYPPQIASEKPQPKPKPKKKRMSNDINTNYVKSGAVDPNQVVVKQKSSDEMMDGVASLFIKRTDKALNETEQLLNRAVDARAAMDTLTESWKAVWIDFMDTTNDRLREIRMSKMAIETEMRQLMASLREVRAFFLDKNYDTEVARLKDFVETCERLQKLKESGFLDKIADTMLVLDSKE